MLVTGATGIGKSLLWTDFVASLPEQWRTFQSNAHLAGPSLEHPFGRLVERVDPAQPPARAIGRDLARVLGKSAADGPVAVCIEDVHFLDPVAISALPEAVQALEGAPVLVTATYRSGAHPPGTPWAAAVAEACAHPSAEEIRLGPLDREAVAAFLQQMHGVDDADAAADLHQRSGGVPLAMVELHAAEGFGHCDLGELLRAKVAAAPATARESAELVAVAGRPVPDEVLARTGHQAGAAALVDIDLAVASDGAVGLRHALLAEAVLADVSGEAARHHHLALAESLAATREPPEAQVASHYAAAGRDSEAAPWAVRAADRCHVRGAHYAACELYEIALRDPPTNARERASLLELASSSASVCGQGVRVASLMAETRQLRDLDDRDRVARRWVNALVFDMADAATAQADQATHTLEAANVAVDRGDLASARTLAADAHEQAAAAGDGETRATAALMSFYAGDFEEAHDRLARLERDALDLGDPALAARALAHRARAVLASGRRPEAIDLERRAAAAARQVQGSDVWAHYQLGVSYHRARGGELAEAERLALEVLALEDPVLSTMAQLPLAVLELERDQVTACRERLDPLLAMARALALDQLTVLVTIVAARVQQLEGDPGAALALADETAALAHSPYHELSSDRHVVAALAAEAAGDPVHLDAAVRDTDELARLLPGDHVVASADTVRAVAARTSGDHDEARARFTSAAEAFERARCWSAAVERWHDAAGERIQLGHRPDPAIGRAESLVTAHGLVRAGRQAADVRARAEASEPVAEELELLTGRERDVLRLLATGSTNREIAQRLYLSDNTVRNYLASVFAKLGVRRRGEAIAAAHRTGLGG